MQNITSSVIPLNTVKEPVEGRIAISLAPITFVTGAEEFSFNVESIPGYKRPSGIITMWIDASGLDLGKNCTIVTDLQKFTVAGGTRGFFAVTGRMPFRSEFTSDGGTGTVIVRLFNYEVIPGESQTIQTISGTVVVNQGTANALPWNENLKQVGGTAISLGQKLMAASIPVVMASDQSSVPVTLLGQPISSITKPTNAGGLMSVSASVGAVATEAKAGPGQMYGMTLGNSNATPVYVQMFDALAANVILGTTAPKYSFLVPAGGTLARDFSNGVEFSNAITFACTSTRTGNVAAANSVDVNFDIC